MAAIIPDPLNHRFTVIRDAVQPKWFTFYTLAGEPFRVFSPDLARRLDDIEEERFSRQVPIEREELVS